MGGNGPHKVAVLGGGLGALTAAFDLTRPELNGRFEVTVYQLGWRLGGKGATGRDAKHDDRIQEHGLHMMMGWYDHVFHLMRDCYEEWDPPADYPIRTIEEAFIPQRTVVLSENLAPAGQDPDWHLWEIPFPKLPGEPWDGVRDDEEPSVLLRRLVGWLAEPARIIGVELEKAAHPKATWSGHATAHEMVTNPQPHHQQSLLKELEALYKLAETKIGDDLTEIGRHLREAWILLRLFVAFAKGLLLDVVLHPHKGWDNINHLDLKDWLESHGAPTPEVSYSAPIRAFYYLTFAFLNGDTSSYKTASVAAGVAAKVMMRIAFTYRNAPFYKMATAMGDTIMTPLYEVLSKRGVKFEFFSRVTDIQPDDSGTTIAAITIDQQAQMISGEYQPLRTVKGLHVWPAEPLWKQLVNGDKLEESGINFESEWAERAMNLKTLTVGTDFDSVVLGISLGALPLMAPKLKVNSAWEAMYNGMPTIQTQAAQLWTIPDLEGLGWTKGPYVASAWLKPMASGIADMTQVIPTENYGDDPPGSVQYLCAPLLQLMGSDPYKDPNYPKKAHQTTFEDTNTWLNETAGRLFPKAAGPNGFNYSVLYGSGTGQQRLQDQYFRANIDPSERYVLTPPDTVHLRLDPANSGFDNLYPAGDWVKTSVNGGSAEAAVEGGDLAAAALIAKHADGS